MLIFSNQYCLQLSLLHRFAVACQVPYQNECYALDCFTCKDPACIGIDLVQGLVALELDLR